MIPLAEARAYVLDRVASAAAAVACRRPTSSAASWPRTCAPSEAIPPFANTAVDGFAVRAADTAGRPRAQPVALAVVGRRRRR